tara:strand:- start:1021 stop:1740 length:720 start_codon:yes stop_codon:yes gene_type:complete
MDNSYWVSGIHSVQAALDNQNRIIEELVLLKDSENKLIISRKIKIEIRDNKFFNKIFKLENDFSLHQGVAARIKPFPKKTIKDILLQKKESTILILDQINDPRNIGAIIRNCIAFNVKFLILENNSTNLKSNAMHRASSGYIEKISFIEVSNINNALLELQKENFYIYGMDSNKGTQIDLVNFNVKKAIVLGSEGKGMRNNVREKCDQLIKIKTTQEMESLNVSNASAIILNHLWNSKN